MSFSRTTLAALVVSVLSTTVPSADAQRTTFTTGWSTLDRQLDVLSGQVLAALGKRQANTKVAVLEFLFLDGRSSAETAYITETFALHFQRHNKNILTLVERGDLSSIREQSQREAELAEEALLDRARMPIRTIQGVDVIVIGTISPLSHGAQLVLKSLDVSTANILDITTGPIDIPRFSNKALNTFSESKQDRREVDRLKTEIKMLKANPSRSAFIPNSHGTDQALAFSAADAVTAARVQKLAIGTFSEQGQSTLASRHLSDHFSALLFNRTPKFSVIAREDINRILDAYRAEQALAKEISSATNALKQKGILEDSEDLFARKVGIEPSSMTRLSVHGVDAILLGRITHLAAGSELTIKILDVKSAFVLYLGKEWIEMPQIRDSRATSALSGQQQAQQSKASQRRQQEELKERKRAEQRAARNAKLAVEHAQQASRAQSSAAISGCPPGSVWIAPRTAPRSGWLLRTAAITVRIINASSNTVSISDESGEVVRNLCAGGGVSLTRYASFGQGNPHFELVATGKTQDNRVAVDRRQFYIQTNPAAHTTGVWEIRMW